MIHFLSGVTVLPKIVVWVPQLLHVVNDHEFLNTRNIQTIIHKPEVMIDNIKCKTWDVFGAICGVFFLQTAQGRLTIFVDMSISSKKFDIIKLLLSKLKLSQKSSQIRYFK